MKVVLLAGGFGTRLSEYTESIPKPMVTVGDRPILWHIMSIYAHFGHKDFYLALGYKAEVIKEYFLHYPTLNTNFTVNLGTGKVRSKWFHAEKTGSEILLTAKGKRDQEKAIRESEKGGGEAGSGSGGGGGAAC